MLTTPEEEAAARTLLHSYVADVHAPEDVLDVLEPVQAGARRRRTVRRTGYALGTAAVAAACAAAFVPTVLSGPATGSHPLSGGASVSVVSGQDVCPARRAGSMKPLAKPVGVPADYTHTLVPGKPVAAFSCPFDGSAPVSVPLSATQLDDAVSVLDAIPASGIESTAIVNEPCESPLTKNGALYLVFEYANGARLMVTAFGWHPCGDRTQTYVTWQASNAAASGSTTTRAQTDALEALAALR